MIDLHQRLSELDQLEAPDMRADIEQRCANPPTLPRDSIIEPTPTQSPWRGPLIAFATAAAILAIVAGTALLLLRDDPGEVTDQTETPSSSTVAPPDTTLPTTPQATYELHYRGDAADVGWTAVVPPIWQPVTRLASGLWVSLDPGWQCHNADGYHAFCDGQEWFDPDADPTEILWTSTNGTGWTAHEVPEFDGMVVNAQGSFWYYLQPLDGWLWVQASMLNDAAAGDPWSGRFWITEDGETWTQLPFGPLDPGPPAAWNSVDAVSHLDEVAFVTLDHSGEARHLVSTDRGRHFTKVDPFPEGESLVAQWSTDYEIRAIVTNSSNGLNLWRSTDGKDWEVLGTVSGVTAEELHNFAASSEALLAGPERDYCRILSFDWNADRDWHPDAPIARSLDGGLTWHELDVFAAMPTRHPPLVHLGCVFASIGDWFIVQQNEVAWVSRNGEDWYSLDGHLYRGPDGWLPELDREFGFLIPPAG